MMRAPPGPPRGIVGIFWGPGPPKNKKKTVFWTPRWSRSGCIGPRIDLKKNKNFEFFHPEKLHLRKSIFSRKKQYSCTIDPSIAPLELLLKIFVMIFKAPGGGMDLLAVYIGLERLLWKLLEAGNPICVTFLFC